MQVFNHLSTTDDTWLFNDDNKTLESQVLVIISEVYFWTWVVLKWEISKYMDFGGKVGFLNEKDKLCWLLLPNTLAGFRGSGRWWQMMMSRLRHLLWLYKLHYKRIKRNREHFVLERSSRWWKSKIFGEDSTLMTQFFECRKNRFENHIKIYANRLLTIENATMSRK